MENPTLVESNEWITLIFDNGALRKVLFGLLEIVVELTWTNVDFGSVIFGRTGFLGFLHLVHTLLMRDTRLS